MNVLKSKLTKKEIKAKFNVGKLLSDGGTNAKTAKNNVQTFILYMSPYNLNSKKINICPMASAGCAAACLYSAGRGKFSNVQKARTNKTEFYLANKQQFIISLADEILFQVKKSIIGSYDVAFRLNGTSDLDLVYLLKKYANLDISDLPGNVYFYDYTAILGKAIKYRDHKNYTVTFSRKENNEVDTIKAINAGINVAAVFKTLPLTWKGANVVDGDNSDLEMLKYKGVILGLKAKGDAKKDKTGFVIINN